MKLDDNLYLVLLKQEYFYYEKCPVGANRHDIIWPKQLIFPYSLFLCVYKCFSWHILQCQLHIHYM